MRWSFISEDKGFGVGDGKIIFTIRNDVVIAYLGLSLQFICGGDHQIIPQMNRTWDEENGQRLDLIEWKLPKNRRIIRWSFG